jgi:hypothetical protein
MTDQKHPITPPPELVEDWAKRFIGPNGLVSIRELVAQAARWGADQELDACSNFLERELWGIGEDRIGDLLEKLYAERRPKPLTLKELALDELDRIPTHDNEGRTVGVDASIIRRALESLPE